MSEMLTFSVELEVSRSATVWGQAGGVLHELYTKWVDGGKLDSDWENLAEFLEGEIDINDLEFWVEDVRLVK